MKIKEAVGIVSKSLESLLTNLYENFIVNPFGKFEM